jgi:hypothetical protein
MRNFAANLFPPSGIEGRRDIPSVPANGASALTATRNVLGGPLWAGLRSR